MRSECIILIYIPFPFIITLKKKSGKIMDGHEHRQLAHSGSIASIYVEQEHPTRSSMDLIEGTSQHLSKGAHHHPESAAVVDAHTQRQRWDAFFEPQYSFGAFIHGLNQEEEEEHQKQQHRKKIDQLIDDGNENLDHTLKSPKMIIDRASCDYNGTEASSAIMSPTLPSLSDKKPAWGPKDEKTLIERLEILKKMRAQTAIVDEHQQREKKSKEETSHTARWKRHMSEKAKKICKEATDDTSSTHSSLDPDEKAPEVAVVDLEEGAPVKKYSCRRSFLCFMLGFIFPPFWLFGAFYFSSYANKQTSASRRIDHIWRRRSRIAFGIFTVFLMITLVVIFVLKPGAIGWRLSKSGGS